MVPERAIGIDMHLRFNFVGCQPTGLHIRNCIACPTDGNEAPITIDCSLDTWADVLTGDLSLSDAITDKKIKVVGDRHKLLSALQVFDIPNLQS